MVNIMSAIVIAFLAMVVTAFAGIELVAADDLWTFEHVDYIYAGGRGEHSSIAVGSDNTIHMSSFDCDTDDLRYAKWDGSQWHKQTVDSLGDVGQHTSISLDSNNHPHISYWKRESGMNGFLKYAKWTGSSWDIQTVDTYVRKTFLTIAIDSKDRPHISYTDNKDYYLKYAKWTGSRWDIQIVDPIDTRKNNCIALDSNDYPHIAYHDYDNDNLKYAKWTGSGWDIQTVDSEGQVGKYPSIAVDANNHPHISYSRWDTSPGQVKYAKWTGSSWNIQVADALEIWREFTSIALDSSNYPHISYRSGDVLKYAGWTGSSWDIQTVDEDAMGYPSPRSIAIDPNGHVHLSYQSCELEGTSLVHAKSTFAVALPDLTLSPDDITFSNPNPEVGETVTITATIHNIGDADAEEVIVQFFDGDPDNGGTQIGNDQTIASINAGGTGTAQVDWTATAVSYAIYVVVDPYDDIPESNEDNNAEVKVRGLSCTCGDICVNETGWWRDGGAFNASGTPIQAAIDNATAGDIICVKDGTYTENVDVYKRLTIRSENGAALTSVQGASSNDHVFTVTADYVNISGLYVTGATGNGKAGLYLYDANYCNISDNNASGNFYGIWLYLSSENELTRNTANENNNYGVWLDHSSENELTRNTASDNYFGIILYYSSNNNTLVNNTALDNNYGFWLYLSSNNNTLADNIANENNYCGILLRASSENELTRNTASGNANYDFYSHEDSHSNIVEDLKIASSPTTISFTYDNGVGLKGVNTVPPDPTGETNIGKYVNATKVTVDSWLFLNVSYRDCDLGGVDEDSLRMWKYDGTWTEVPPPNGVNNVENYVYANITVFSIFAPLGNPSGVLKPDLIITEKWLCSPDNCTICYNVTNIGNEVAPACHHTTLYVDEVEVAHDHVPVDLEHGESYTGSFNGYVWAYTSPSDNITVCADNNETIDELDEDNNCLTNIWRCGDVNCDGKVTMSDVRKVFNRYLDPNYPLELPWAADVNCDGKVTMSDVRKVFNRYLDPGYELKCCCEGIG